MVLKGPLLVSLTEPCVSDHNAAECSNLIDQKGLIDIPLKQHGESQVYIHVLALNITALLSWALHIIYGNMLEQRNV